MRKYGLYLLIAVGLLVGCQKKYTAMDTTTAQTSAEETKTTESAKVTVPEESKTSGETDAKEPESTGKLDPIPIAVTGEYDGEWDDSQTPIITSRCDRVFVQGDGYETLKSGMEKEFGADRVRCYNGHEVGTAVSLAENADIIVLALGGSSSRFKGALFDENGAAKVQGVLEMDCGEGMDTARLQLPGNQNELFTAVCALKKPVISVVIAGRPYAIPEIAQDSDALLYAFYPGPMGGKAIAELLSGKYAPSGRLPVSLPRNCGQLPVYYNHTVSYPAMHYCDMEQGVLYTFGEGMGYSHMEYVDICLKKQQDVWIISGIVKNKGNIDDTAVLQCYRKVLSGELVPRERELVAFSRIKVEKGSHKAFEIVMDADKFRYFNESGAKIYKSKILLMDSGKIIFEE